jgi:hypothetical protein
MNLPVGAFVGPGILPTDSPVESLDSVIRADQAGIESGRANPTIATAIAQGAGAALDSYQEQRVIDANVALREAQTQAAQQRASGGGLSASAIRANLELRKQQKAAVLGQIVGSGSQQQINEAFSSGQFADIIGDREIGPALLGNAVLRGLDPRIADEYKSIYNRGAQKSYEDKTRALHQKSFEEGEQALQGQGFYSAVASQSNISPRDAIRNGRLVPSGSYGLTEKGTVKPKEGGVLFDTSDEVVRSYDLYDETTGRIIATGFDKETKKAFVKVKGSSNILGDTPYNDPPQVKAIEEAQKATGQNRAAPQAATQQQTQEQAQKLSTRAFRDIVSAQRLIDPINAAPNVVNNPLLQSSIAASVGLSSTKSVRKDLQNILSIPLSTNQELAQNAESIRGSVNAVINAVLREQYEKNKELLAPTYNEKAVRKHNREVQTVIKAIEDGTPEAVNIRDLDQLLEVNSPEDLYIANNYKNAQTVLRNNLNILRDAVATQNKQAIAGDNIKSRINALGNKYR